MDRKEEYLAKLRDPRWQKMRLKVLERDEFMCQQCFDSKSTLHVHHRWYETGKEPWEYRLQALVTLCETCHEEESVLLSDHTHDLVLMLKQGHALSAQFRAFCSALVSATEYPLDEVEWSILIHTIGSILRDRRDDSLDVNKWGRARDEYFAWCSIQANSSTKKTDVA